MAIKPIRTEADYEESLARLEALIDAEPGTPEADELEVLATLIERYEDKRFPITAPSPLVAIRFRMEQEGLTPRDLEPFIGSRGRVSEVLNGTRPLSIDMIRALNRHLGIPADALIASGPTSENADPPVLSRAAVKQLAARGLLQANEAFEAFMARAFGGAPAMALLRKTRTARTNAKTDIAAVQAWCAGAVLASENLNVAGRFIPDRTDFAEMAKLLVKQSVHEDGPLRARESLAEFGIALVVLPHLPGTHLDGAAMRRSDGTPVVALTLRRDRIDNFWFTLTHELAHVTHHLSDDALIVDDLEISSSEIIEQEADLLAANALVPEALWATFDSSPYTCLADILELARRAEVNPAIVAGKWQQKNKDFRKFSKLLGNGTVRRLFPEF